MSIAAFAVRVSRAFDASLTLSLYDCALCVTSFDHCQREASEYLGRNVWLLHPPSAAARGQTHISDKVHERSLSLDANSSGESREFTLWR